MYNSEGKVIRVSETSTMDAFPHQTIYLCKTGTAWTPLATEPGKAPPHPEPETKKQHRKSLKLDKTALERDLKSKKEKEKDKDPK